MPVPDNKINKISKDLMPYNWEHNASFHNLNSFKKLTNWLSAEFTLYLQEERDGLTVYFPNGFFSIKALESKNSSINFNIKVKSKCKRSGTIIFNQIILILNHLTTFAKETL